ncbi:MAG: transketolase [Helicobacteraceae bacterium]|jgi:transketolase|nr:transketolase [Helicobacteraceae bacterium]
MLPDRAIVEEISNTIRFLAADMVQKANSGHPGMPMGLADAASAFSFHFRHNPNNPQWLNRDRVVFSGGHGSALVYSLLHLWGYPLTLDDLKAFRQLDSKTPGHPERDCTKGVEVTTGPLGQGFANAVGFAFAAKRGRALLGEAIIDHKIWCFCGDGDIMEGISYEAASFAGHNALDNLIVIYDSNDVTIDGALDICFSEDVAARFRAQRWDVIETDGHDFERLDRAFSEARNQTKPTIIIAKTKIAKGAASLEGSPKSHGAPLGKSEIAASKLKARWNAEPFYIPQTALAWLRTALEKGELYEREWNDRVLRSDKKPLLDKLLNPDFNSIQYPVFDDSPKATRDTNGEIINAIAKALPGFFGGSADLAGSNKTELKGLGVAPLGANIRFGIREHAMSAITNAIALYGLFIPFDSTFFVFSDYQKPAARVAALTSAKRFFIWTHDSLGVGEDGATHQPVEQLSTLRALPNFYAFRPADGRENIVAWKTALTLDAPSAFVLSRQALPALPSSAAKGDPSKGGYLISLSKQARITLIASGSEVALALAAKDILQNDKIGANVVSVPCFDLFVEQDESYIETIIDPDTIAIAIEAASGIEWFRFAEAVVGMESFGASASADRLFDRFGFTPDRVAELAKSLLAESSV